MKFFHLLLSTILVAAATTVFILIMLSIHRLFVIFTPFFLIIYLAVGWGFSNSYNNKEIEHISYIRMFPLAILFFPPLYFVKSIQNIFKK